MSVNEAGESDEQLAEVIQRRDESAAAMRQGTAAFEQLYERHARLLLAFLASRVKRSDLEDVHQSVWQKIWQNLPRHFKGGNFRAWLYQIARNHLVDLSRKRRPDELGDAQEPVDHSAPDDPLADQERQEILSRCLQKMQKHMAEIVRGRLSGEDYSSICSRLEIKVCAGSQVVLSRTRETNRLCAKGNAVILYAFEIPESHQDRAKWLERMVTGLHLSELVGELHAVHGPPRESQQLAAIVGDQLPAVLERGFSELSDGQLQSLLTNPDCLFELQDEVIVNGSSYWQDVSGQQDDFADVMGTGSSIVQSAMEPSADVAEQVTDADVQPASPYEIQQGWYKHPLLVAVATAAVVLLAVNLRQRYAPKEVVKPVQVAKATGWGWDRPGALKSDQPADEYLRSLADSADEWFNKRPESACDLAVRVAQFRQGCSTLILAAHSPLAEEDKAWLVEKCRAWAGKLDAHLVAIEAGEPVMTVREAADATIRKLQTAMRARADEVG